MGYPPPPNVWAMSDDELAAWLRAERRRMVIKFAILLVGAGLFAALALVVTLHHVLA